VNGAEGSHVMGRKPKGPKPHREAEEVKTKRKQNIKERQKNEYLIPKSPTSYLIFFFLSTKQFNK